MTYVHVEEDLTPATGILTGLDARPVDCCWESRQEGRRTYHD